MQNSRLPVILLFLGLGILSYQFLFHSSNRDNDLTKRLLVGRGDLAEDAVDSNTDSADANFSSMTRKNPKPHAKQVLGPIVGLAPAAPAPEVASPEASPPPQAPPLDMKALAKATDEKAKAGEKKKKKKKKTVSPNPDVTTQNLNQTQTPIQAANSTPEEPIAAAAPSSPIIGEIPDGLEKPNGAAITAANAKYYEKILLKEPNLSETQKFVALHKARQVTDDVYFTVAAAMMADPRLQMKDLAVYVYGQTFHIKSFVALVGVLDTDHSNDIVKTDSIKSLNMYSDVTKAGTIPVLAQSLAMPKTSPSLHLEALKLLDFATKQYALLEMSQPPPGSGQLGVLAYNPANAQRLFVPFVNILGTMIRTATDSNTKTLANQDLLALQNLFGSQSASINL